ncbi:MAG: SGNH/GDSL hydrolase family protein [Ruminococcaceae bacterium]|nr:SGNH/GDSL hydrolase family protein [Oscillospiraceae bacterium]
MRISVFGDSILKGVILENGKYIMDSDTKRRLTDDCGLDLDTHCKFGATVNVGSRLLDREFRRGEPGKYTVLEFGGNDSDYDWAKIAAEPDKVHLSNTPPEAFEKTYADMILTVRESGSIPVVATLPPISAARYFRWICRDGLDPKAILHWLGDIDIIFRKQELYSRMAEALAEKFKCAVLDLRAAFPTEKNALEAVLCDDGIHPNRLGQELIYRRCLSQLAHV